jgi:hypothetical protein
MNLRGKLRELLGLDLIARGVAEGFADARRGITYSNDALERLAARKVEAPPAFVCLLVEGTYEPGPRQTMTMVKGRERWTTVPSPPRRIWLGDGKLITRNDTLEVRTNVPLSDVRAIVFADLARVTPQLFIGSDLMAAAVGLCPVGYAERLEVAVSLRVSCMLEGSR